MCRCVIIDMRRTVWISDRQRSPATASNRGSEFHHQQQQAIAGGRRRRRSREGVPSPKSPKRSQATARSQRSQPWPAMASGRHQQPWLATASHHHDGSRLPPSCSLFVGRRWRSLASLAIAGVAGVCSRLLVGDGSVWLAIACDACGPLLGRACAACWTRPQPRIG